ncbi:hypothetical protein E2320_019767, partial [Naja naja]
MGMFLLKGSELLVTPERYVSVQAGRRDIYKQGRYVAVFSSPLCNLASGGEEIREACYHFCVSVSARGRGLPFAAGGDSDRKRLIFG